MDFVPLAFITELVYPPMKIPSQALKDLYMKISDGYGFTTFRLLTGGRGAQLVTERKKECSILHDKIVYKDEVTEQTFDGFREEVTGMVRQIRDLLHIPVFVSHVVILRVLFPVRENALSTDFIYNRLLGFQPSQTNVFSRPVSGAGIRLVFPPTQTNLSEFQIRIEPYFRDLKMLFIENTARFFQPVQTPEQVRENLQACYGFVAENLTQFLFQGTGGPGGS